MSDRPGLPWLREAWSPAVRAAAAAARGRKKRVPLDEEERRTLGLFARDDQHAEGKAAARAGEIVDHHDQIRQLVSSNLAQLDEHSPAMKRHGTALRSLKKKLS